MLLTCWFLNLARISLWRLEVDLGKFDLEFGRLEQRIPPLGYFLADFVILYFFKHAHTGYVEGLNVKDR